jgi:5'-3' exonuclease
MAFRVLWIFLVHCEFIKKNLKRAQLTVAKQACAEAEAELAYLNKFGHIDAVLSEDVDALIFGAKRVIR